MNEASTIVRYVDAAYDFVTILPDNAESVIDILGKLIGPDTVKPAFNKVFNPTYKFPFKDESLATLNRPFNEISSVTIN